MEMHRIQSEELAHLRKNCEELCNLMDSSGSQQSKAPEQQWTIQFGDVGFRQAQQHQHQRQQCKASLRRKAPGEDPAEVTLSADRDALTSRRELKRLAQQQRSLHGIY